jgi:hydroxymethylbilane synthase
MCLAAITARETPADVCIMSPANKSQTLASLPAGAIVGTSSLRRSAQLKRSFPHLQIADIRGNLNTRLSKLDSGMYDCIILAYAGVHRLGWDDRVSEFISSEIIMHAVGQGALGIECRTDDEETIQTVQSLNDEESALRCTAERAFMRTLEGGCSVPLGVDSWVRDGVIGLIGSVTKLDGSKRLEKDHKCAVAGTMDEKMRVAVELGERVAASLLELGAKEILDSIRNK